jgi:pimeloyl-ACP methyl ester carboxylesterase
METAISKDGTSIAFDRTGKGPALVLVDGAFCFRNNGPAPQLIPLLSRYFTVYAYDRRGRGESTETLPYDVEREIEDLASVIEKTGEVPSVLGFSSGAALVLRAITRGVKFKNAALFEPPYVAGSGLDNAPPKDAETTLSNLVKAGKRGDAVKYFMTKVMGIPGIFVLLFKLIGKESWKKNEGVAHTLSYDVAIMGDFAVPSGLATSVTVRTAVIGGEKSPEKLKKAIEALSKSILQSQKIILKGQSHNVSMKVLAPVLLDFFNPK